MSEDVTADEFRRRKLNQKWGRSEQKAPEVKKVRISTTPEVEKKSHDAKHKARQKEMGRE